MAIAACKRITCAFFYNRSLILLTFLSFLQVEILEQVKKSAERRRKDKLEKASKKIKTYWSRVKCIQVLGYSKPAGNQNVYTFWCTTVKNMWVMRWKMIATMEKVTRVNEEEKLSVVSQFLQILSGSQAHKQVRVFFYVWCIQYIHFTVTNLSTVMRPKAPKSHLYLTNREFRFFLVYFLNPIWQRSKSGANLRSLPSLFDFNLSTIGAHKDRPIGRFTTSP